MAQFEFFSAENDRPILLKALFADTAILAVWDGWYASKEIPVYDGFSLELITRVQKKRRCFLVQESFKNSIQMGLVEQATGPEAGNYRFALERLPSGVELTFPACFEQGGGIYLRSGALAYPREVYNHEKQKWESPEQARRQLFRKAKTIFQRVLQHATIDGVSHRIGPKAVELIRAGEAKILAGHASLAHSQKRSARD